MRQDAMESKTHAEAAGRVKECDGDGQGRPREHVRQKHRQRADMKSEQREKRNGAGGPVMRTACGCGEALRWDHTDSSDYRALNLVADPYGTK